MPYRIERGLFQAAVFLAALVPIAAGTAGVLHGSAMIPGARFEGADLESHFRYLSGLLLGIGLAFMVITPRIERNTALFRALCLIVVAGGIARLIGAIEVGIPGMAHRLALIMELGVVPAMVLWVGRIERRSSRPSLQRASDRFEARKKANIARSSRLGIIDS